MPSQAHTAQQQLQFSELRYRRLFEAAQDGILILNGDTGDIIDANPFLQKMLEYSGKELMGKKLWQIGTFKDVADSKAAFSVLKKEGYIRYRDLPLETKGGRKIDVEFVSNLYKVGQLRVIQCNIRDITDRITIENSQKKTTAAMLNVMEDLETAKNLLEVAKAKDEAMLNSIGEGLVAVDNKGMVVVMNKAAERILGLRIKDMINRPVTDIPLEYEDGRKVSKSQRPTYMALSQNATVKAVFNYITPLKTKFPLAITATPIKLGKMTIGLIEIIRDISREQEIDRAKSEFVSLASHQLRTPLGIIKWYLEALENDIYIKSAPPEVTNHIKEIYKSNKRLLSLVRDLLSVSRIDQGKVKNLPEKVDVKNIIVETVRLMSTVADKKNIGLSMVIMGSPRPLVINIDPLRFHEVLENLVTNAIEYTSPGGKVDIEVKRFTTTLQIRVKDTGIGISLADQKKLFTKFFRSERAIEFNPEGSGLGLYVIKSYVEDWGGKVNVKSVEGKGSEFTVTLPLKGGDKDEKNTNS